MRAGRGRAARRRCAPAIPERASTLHRLLRLRPGLDARRLRSRAPAARRRGGGRRGVDGRSRADGEARARAAAGRAAGPARRQGPARVGRGGRRAGRRVRRRARLLAVFRRATVGVVTGETVPAGGRGAGLPLRDAVVLLRESRRFARGQRDRAPGGGGQPGDGDEAWRSSTAGADDRRSGSR